MCIGRGHENVMSKSTQSHETSNTTRKNRKLYRWDNSSVRQINFQLEYYLLFFFYEGLKCTVEVEALMCLDFVLL